jgi:hypothetical protein
VSIQCEACTLPVDEHVVRCPHCGGFTGVPVDPAAAAAVESLTVLAGTPRVDMPPDGPFEAVGRIVNAAIEVIVPRRSADAEPLPRATARRRPKTER